MKQINRELLEKKYREAKKVIVAGGRDFDDYAFLKESLMKPFFSLDKVEEVGMINSFPERTVIGSHIEDIFTEGFGPQNGISYHQKAW